jgi:hypothetical protein
MYVLTPLHEEALYEAYQTRLRAAKHPSEAPTAAPSASEAPTAAPSVLVTVDQLATENKLLFGLLMGTIATNVGEKRRAPGAEENILSHSQMIQVISKVEETQALDTFLLAPNSATTSAPTTLPTSTPTSIPSVLSVITTKKRSVIRKIVRHMMAVEKRPVFRTKRKNGLGGLSQDRAAEVTHEISGLRSTYKQLAIIAELKNQTKKARRFKKMADQLQAEDSV